MYFATIILLMLILPVASVSVDMMLSQRTLSIMFLIGRWFVFWAVGVRLFLAGLRQVLDPSFTAQDIFGIHDPGAFALVREIGFANISIGLLGLCGVFHPGWVISSAMVGGMFYGLAGLGHLLQEDKNAREYTAMVSDGFAFFVLLAFLLDSWL